jgi:two-component system sensor histidine kinase KdpD
MLVNLLDNALKHGAPDAPVELLVRRTGDELMFAVRDRGPGVPPAWRERIFDAFRRGGTGTAGDSTAASTASHDGRAREPNAHAWPAGGRAAGAGHTGEPAVAAVRAGEPATHADRDGEPPADAGRAGAGVGLAVCRAIARAHGSELRLRPRGHGGASFEFALAVEMPPKDMPPEAPPR